MSNTVVCIMGPTASGKTDLAVELLAYLPGAIVSVDSALIYRGMDIGTAKPSPQVLQAAPHYLLDILDPSESYSAADFCRDAVVAIEAIVALGKIPLLVGGTMLYFKALQQGLAVLPTASPALRDELSQRILHEGLASLYQQLATVDPVAAARINPNDPQRIQRALEVFLLTGKSLTQHWQEAPQLSANYNFINISLMPEDRGRLHQQIADRFKIMLAQGFIDEVQQLRARGDLSLALPSMRTVGYRQVWQYLDNEYDELAMQEHAIAATRQLAKRQLTWLRSWPNSHSEDPWQAKLPQRVLSYLRKSGGVVA